MTPTRDDTAEEALYQRCIQGDSSAWSEFVERYRKDVEEAVRVTFHRCLGRVPLDDVENVTQEVYARLYDQGCRRLRSYQGRCPLSLWLKTMAIRMTLNYVTSEKRRGRFGFGSLEKMILSRPRVEEDPELDQERRDLSRMGDLLDRLEPLERTALKMFYFDGMTYRQMSSLLGIPVQTLGSMLSRARVKLRALGRNLEEK